MRHEQRPASLYGTDGRRKYLTPTERYLFMRSAWLCPRSEAAILCMVLSLTGCRISEALALARHDINSHGCFIAFHSLKKRQSRVVREVPVPHFLIALIDARWCEARADARLWSWSRSQAWRLVKHVMVTAGICPGPHQTAKGLRHAFGIHAVVSGVPLNMVQRWLGHANLTTTSIYTQALGGEERAIAARMWSEPAIPIVG